MRNKKGKLGKRGNFGLMQGAALAFVIIGILLVVGLQIIGDVQDSEITGIGGCNATDVTTCSAAFNASADTITGLSDLSSKLPLIATVIGAVIILGFVFMIARKQR